jgi:hypothetical protein
MARPVSIAAVASKGAATAPRHEGHFNRPAGGRKTDLEEYQRLAQTWMALQVIIMIMMAAVASKGSYCGHCGEQGLSGRAAARRPLCRRFTRRPAGGPFAGGRETPDHIIIRVGHGLWAHREPASHTTLYPEINI